MAPALTFPSALPPPFAAPSPSTSSDLAHAWPTSSAAEHAELGTVTQQKKHNQTGAAQEMQRDTHRGSSAQNLNFNQSTTEDEGRCTGHTW